VVRSFIVLFIRSPKVSKRKESLHIGMLNERTRILFTNDKNMGITMQRNKKQGKRIRVRIAIRGYGEQIGAKECMFG